MKVALDSIRGCFEGGVPSLLASCARDGVPNLTYVSQVHYVDREHVALTFQFFNKTYENVRANPQAAAYVADPDTGASYRLQLRYLRTEESGPLFESMKAKLAGIASHTGMSGVFLLRGADVYRVVEAERVPGPEVARPPARCNPMSAVRRISERLATHSDLGTLLDDTLAALDDQLGIGYAKVLLLEAGRGRPPRLYTVATRGYSTSGVGSEIGLGEGVIGTAAAFRTPIRISHFTAEYIYGRAVRDQIVAGGLAEQLETEIPLPGLPAPASQLAVPIILGGRLAGVLYVESPEELRFSYDDEDALVAVATQLGMAIAVLQEAADDENEETPAAGTPARPQPGGVAIVRLYRANDSVFIDDDYLIKGVAGSIFAKLVRDYTAAGRTEFSNRELRLDPAIRLPDIGDNLEARLILLQRRLAERCNFMAIAKTGRGRFHFEVKRPVKLVEVS
ncbi:MAG TPA: GAF domain-containing protein [Burkholderiaceae bacterium]|nr:GAF domain-containing protein [Burkholderiaceae bacterium]